MLAGLDHLFAALSCATCGAPVVFSQDDLNDLFESHGIGYFYLGYLPHQTEEACDVCGQPFIPGRLYLRHQQNPTPITQPATIPEPLSAHNIL